MPNIEEALRRIAHAKATHATTLDLSGLELEKLPEALRELPWLEELRVDAGDEVTYWMGKKSLKTLPSWISELSSLRILIIRNQILEKLPHSLYQINSLKHLDLRDNKINIF